MDPCRYVRLNCARRLTARAVAAGIRSLVSSYTVLLFLARVVRRLSQLGIDLGPVDGSENVAEVQQHLQLEIRNRQDGGKRNRFPLDAFQLFVGGLGFGEGIVVAQMVVPVEDDVDVVEGPGFVEQVDRILDDV